MIQALLISFRTKPWAWVLTYLILLVLGHLVVSFPRADLLGKSIQNALHIPAFAIFTGLLTCTLFRSRPVTAFVVTLITGIVFELLQILTPRDADFSDLLLDLTGSGIVTVGLVLYHRLGNQWSQYWFSGTAIVVCIISLITPASIYSSYLSRDAQFPTLFEARTGKISPLLKSNSPLHFVPAPEDWSGHVGELVLQVAWADRPYPGITFQEVVPNWSAYNTLIIEAYLPEYTLANTRQKLPLKLTTALRYTGEEDTSAYVPRLLKPGPVTLHLPLTRLMRPDSPFLPDISQLVIHTNKTFAGNRLLIASVYLAAITPG